MYLPVGLVGVGKGKCGLNVGLWIVPHPFIPPHSFIRFSASTCTLNLLGELTGKKKMEQSAGNW